MSATTRRAILTYTYSPTMERTIVFTYDPTTVKDSEVFKLIMQSYDIDDVYSLKFQNAAIITFEPVERMTVVREPVYGVETLVIYGPSHTAQH